MAPGRGEPLTLADPRALRVPGAPSFAERSGLRPPPPPPGLPCARAEGRRRPPHAGGGEWRKGLLCVPGRRGRLFLFFPQLKTPARDGRRRRRLHAPARCSSYLTAAAWSVGRASGRSSPAAAPAGCAPRPRPRALPRLGPLATRAAAAPVRMRIRDPAVERAPAARPVAPVRPCPRPHVQAERLRPPRGARGSPSVGHPPP